MDKVVREFGRLLSMGLKSIAARESKPLGSVEEEVAAALGYSVWTVRSFRQGDVPQNQELICTLADTCVERGAMGRQWLQSFLYHAGVSQDKAEAVVCRHFTETSAPSPERLLQPLTSLIDHANDVETIVKQLVEAKVRLQTLCGAPGIGKTRIAEEVAWRLHHAYHRTVVCVRLEHIEACVLPGAAEAEASGRLLATAVAEALGVKRTAGQSVIEDVKDALRQQSLVLILDNFDTVVGAAPLVLTLLQSAPGLQILVTSRQVLKVRGEHQFEVHPLTVPALETPLAHDTLEHYSAVQLLAARLRQNKVDFAITHQNARAVAEICVHLDGIPLAIELVARDCAVFGVEDVLRRLKDGFHRNPTSPYQGSLKATIYSAIAWSYERLPQEESTLFRRLAVFANGCTHSAVEAICLQDRGDDKGAAVRSGVEALVSKSLLCHEQGADGVARYRLLQPIREYASKALCLHGEEGWLRRHHADYFLAQVEDNEQNVWQPQGAAACQLVQDLENIRAALRWYAECGDDTALLRMTGALAWFWCVNENLFQEAYDWAQQALGRCGGRGGIVPADVRAKALCAVGVLAWSRGELADALAALHQSLDLYRARGELWGMCVTTNYLGSILRDQGDFDGATPHFQACLALCHQRKDPVGIAMQLDNLGDVAIYMKRYAEARRWCEQALSYRQAGGDTWGVAGSLLNLARIARDQGAYDEAAELAYQSLETYYGLNTVWDIPQSLEVLAAVAFTEARPTRATWLLGAAAALRDHHGYRLPPVDRPAYDQLVRAVRAALDEQSFATAWAEGREMTQKQALDAAQRLLPSRSYGLSPREQEVASKLGQLQEAEASEAQLAREWLMEEKDLKRHITCICNRLELVSRDQIKTWALRKGLAMRIDEPDTSPLRRDKHVDDSGCLAQTLPREEGPPDLAPMLDYIAGYWSQITRHHLQDENTLIGLPHPYLVPSHQHMFQEFYYWDSYFMALGVIGTAYEHLILSMAENMAFLCERFGIIPNGSRYYFLSRSQPPFFTALIWLAYQVKQRRGDSDVRAYLERMMRVAEREHETVWMGTAQPHHRQVFAGLSRYFDINYLDVLAACESGWDHSTRCEDRWLDHLPVDLNAILYAREQDFARAAELLGQVEKAAYWRLRANQRAETMCRLMWDEDQCFFFDYDWQHQRRTLHPSLAGFYVLWAGLAPDEYAKRMVQRWLPQFEHVGGLVTTLDEQAGRQWSYPNGWAPLQWLVVTGLQRYGYVSEARRVMQKWCANCATIFAASGTLWEKYNVVAINAEPEGGLYGSVPGFGWSNGVFVDFVRRLNSNVAILS